MVTRLAFETPGYSPRAHACSRSSIVLSSASTGPRLRAFRADACLRHACSMTRSSSRGDWTRRWARARAKRGSFIVSRSLGPRGRLLQMWRAGGRRCKRTFRRRGRSPRSMVMTSLVNGDKSVSRCVDDSGSDRKRQPRCYAAGRSGDVKWIVGTGIGIVGPLLGAGWRCQTSAPSNAPSGLVRLSSRG